MLTKGRKEGKKRRKELEEQQFGQGGGALP